MTKPQTREELFHESLAAYCLHSISWHRTLQAARTCINLGYEISERNQHFVQDLVNLAYAWNEDYPEHESYVSDLTKDEALQFVMSYCSRPFKNYHETLQGLWDLNDQWGIGNEWEYIKSQPFEALKAWIEFNDHDDYIQQHLEEEGFSDVESFKYFEPNWHARLEALIPGYKPWEEPYVWVNIPGFSRYQLTDDPDAEPWNLRCIVDKSEIPGPIYERRIDYDLRDENGNPTETYKLYSDENTFETHTFEQLLKLTTNL